MKLRHRVKRSLKYSKDLWWGTNWMTKSTQSWRTPSGSRWWTPKMISQHSLRVWTQDWDRRSTGRCMIIPSLASNSSVYKTTTTSQSGCVLFSSPVCSLKTWPSIERWKRSKPFTSWSRVKWHMSYQGSRTKSLSTCLRVKLSVPLI